MLGFYFVMMRLFLFLILLGLGPILLAQPGDYWHGKQRELRYQPKGEGFVIVNGKNRFNRALYGTNTAFRIETGDVPEFGFFMPNMGGNLQMGIVNAKSSCWLNQAEQIISTYIAGKRIYEIRDSLLGEGSLVLTVLAMADDDGMIMQVRGDHLPDNLSLLIMYGGASNKRFSRNGDLGVDAADCFALKADACFNNQYSLSKNTFQLRYGIGSKTERQLEGVFPVGTDLRTGSPEGISSPWDVWRSVDVDNKPVLVGKIPLTSSDAQYLCIKKPASSPLIYDELEACFNHAEHQREKISSSVKITTPDPYMNPLGGVLSSAADAIWEDCWLHGAIGWRMPLNGWRAAYTGDVVGWHDRSRTHFNAYAASQVKHIKPVMDHPRQDSTLNLARAEKKWGTQMYSNGYICRNPYDTAKMHHYDMNLCYIDELLWHLNWTGDLEYAREMWPVISRHLAWEKRNFDPDNDGLYDAYASIWASDALYYNSGGVTHSSAYNFRANRLAAEIAVKIGEDGAPYKKEADRILKAINSQLWLDKLGWWAEYKDFMGGKMIHPNAGVWTVYHALDSDVSMPFQAYQAMRYIDTQIPKIPVNAKGLEADKYSTISTSNWLPYSWSINNVAFAEVAHTCLAYWQAGRNNEAFNLFKSAVLDGMYVGSSPGNIGQISFYDAARGECYRDFGDPVGVYTRAVVQGLFGITPDLLNNRIVVRPGFPDEWNQASISTSDVQFSFSRDGSTDTYRISPWKNHDPKMELYLKAYRDRIKAVRINGKPHLWEVKDDIGSPGIRISFDLITESLIEIEWEGDSLNRSLYSTNGINGENWSLRSPNTIIGIYDPQEILENSIVKPNTIDGCLKGVCGQRTLFVHVQQGDLTWWEPVGIEIKEPFSVEYNSENKQLQFKVTNNCTKAKDVELVVNAGYKPFRYKLSLPSGATSGLITVPGDMALFGTNRIHFLEQGETIFQKDLINWEITFRSNHYEMVNIDRFYNASVNVIFKNAYLSPRSPYTTLQIPKQGIGEWCHPLQTANIDDSGFRAVVHNGVFSTPMNIPFRSVADSVQSNVVFTSLWDNYPNEATLPLKGKAGHAYLLMAGTTNHMQCHVPNGVVVVRYKDGSVDELTLVNPDNWVPIEQDLFIDGYAFKCNTPRPYRVAFKSGIVSRNLEQDLGIHSDEVYGRVIDGGAGILIDLPLDSEKKLESLTIKTLANDVVIGLLGITLVR